MKPSRNLLFFAFLALFCLIIHLYSRDSLRAELGYSSGFFARFSPFLRSFTRIWTLSLGDLLYLFLGGYLLFRFIRFWVRLFRKGENSRSAILKKTLFSAAFFLMGVYILFNLLWGINYNRKGIAWQLEMKVEKPKQEDLVQINADLLEKLNHSALQVESNHLKPLTNAEVFSGAAEAYAELKKEYSFLSYQPPSIKSSLFSTLGNYAGFMGYYNPFTGEAQVNTSIPAFLHPYVACHEVAHQIGYAKEMEANFVGYLAASRSRDARFQYSVYLDLFLYANRDLYRKDSLAAKRFRDSLAPCVLKDLEEWKAFNRRHESFLDPLISSFYDRFLKSNNDPDGMNSYARVTALLAAYRKKTGKI